MKPTLFRDLVFQEAYASPEADGFLFSIDGRKGRLEEAPLSDIIDHAPLTEFLIAKADPTGSREFHTYDGVDIWITRIRTIDCTWYNIGKRKQAEAA